MVKSASSGAFALAGLLTMITASPTSRLLSKREGVTAWNAENAFHALQQWYNPSNGLWLASTGWWNSANCITVIANLAAIEENVKSSATHVFATTHTAAAQYNNPSWQVAKSQGTEAQPYLPQSHFVNMTGSMAKQSRSGFLNGYYDDEGWWTLGWAAAYDVTGNADYLSESQAIFDDMIGSFGKTNCSTNSGGKGGIWWDKPNTYVNAIANELFFSAAAHLANRKGSSKMDYLSIAKQQLAWFRGSGMINSHNTINDGLDQSSCQNNGGTVWSYNQGVILGGLVELSKATGDSSYITMAQHIADAAMAALAPHGILTDPCEPNCGGDGSQFKGVFMRNLQVLQLASPQTRYSHFLDANAESIWAKDRDASTNELSISWAGPYVSPANASTQSSAMDALVASLAT